MTFVAMRAHRFCVAKNIYPDWFHRRRQEAIAMSTLFWPGLSQED